jgi:hypothetical protein
MRDLIEQTRTVTAALGPSPAMRDLIEQTRSVSAALTASPAWHDFANTLVAISDIAAVKARTATDNDDLATTAVTVMTTAAAIDVAATVEPEDQLETYDFSSLLDPSARRPIQATVAVIVFIETFAWVVKYYDLASQLNTLTGAGPLLAAQVAWSMTGKILAEFEETL